MEFLSSKFYKNPPSKEPNKSPTQTPPKPRHIPSSPALSANFSSANLTTGAGVAIFHLATSRVVICRTRSRHTHEQYYFLPKGRRDAHEQSNLTAAEREGYEESGYRNRILPLPIEHRQPITNPLVQGNDTDKVHEAFAREALWTQLMPLSRDRQYLLFWYAAETVPREVDEELTRAMAASEGMYQSPPEFPAGLTLKKRIAQDEIRGEDGHITGFYEPVRHEGTGVDEEEAQYESFLVPIEDALRHLRGTIMGDVVRKAWEAIRLRISIENDTYDGRD